MKRRGADLVKEFLCLLLRCKMARGLSVITAALGENIWLTSGEDGHNLIERWLHAALHPPQPKDSSCPEKHPDWDELILCAFPNLRSPVVTSYVILQSKASMSQADFSNMDRRLKSKDWKQWLWWLETAFVEFALLYLSVLLNLLIPHS